MARYFLSAFLVCCFARLVFAREKPRFAGPTESGFLLPNGWHLTPAGRHVTITDLPLNIWPLPDSKHAIVATSGYNKHELSVVDLLAAKVIAQSEVRQSWFGLVGTRDAMHFWWSGGGNIAVHRFDWNGHKLIRTGEADQEQSKLTPAQRNQLRGFTSGLCLSADESRIYSLDIERGLLTVADRNDSGSKQTATIGGKPYDVALGRNGLLYVSDWSGKQILAVEPKDLRVIARIGVGEHPNQIAMHPKDDRLFVACASSNCVTVIDTRRGIVTETIHTSLFPRAPEGSTPDALALTPDGKTLFAANADNNCVAVIDVEQANESQVKGFIPTGWYPTSLAVTPDHKHLLVGVGKGNQTRANPIVKKQGKTAEPPGMIPNYPYIGTTMSGALSIVRIPDEKQLKEYTTQVYRNCPYSDQLLSSAAYPRKTAIPTRVGDPSPIKHVIYIIKENRTYDQVFGDLPRGNGDPSLVMFGRNITPNHHKLVEEFVLLDNLYCNGQVSRDGHPWSTMAYHTDYIARDWHITYSGRRGIGDDDEGHLANGPSGYLWDACARARLTYRSYGEYGKRVSQADGSYRMEGLVPGLIGHMSPDYGLPARGVNKVRDTDRVVTFLKEFAEYEKKGNLPQFIIMSLPEDHTFGTMPGQNTPQACVANNDLALGRLVEGVSKSKYWKEIAIFVIEDDAQNGPDHVDAHRTVGLVISPYVRRGHVDSTQYATVSLIRTMELILGLAPLSQYDAAARPMFESFTANPDLRSYQHEPARIDPQAENTKVAYGAERSLKMDFSDVDRIDDFELNEILWRAIKGANAPLPPTVRRAIAFRSQASSLGKR